MPYEMPPLRVLATVELERGTVYAVATWLPVGQRVCLFDPRKHRPVATILRVATLEDACDRIHRRWHDRGLFWLCEDPVAMSREES